MTITIEVTGNAERLLGALCDINGTTAEEIARDGIAAALNGFNYQRADSRGLMTGVPQAERRPIGPDLEPGEAERIRELAQLAIAMTQTTTNRNAMLARMRELWPEGI